MEDVTVSPMIGAETGSAVPWPPQNLDGASEPFVGQWNRLVSTTNWEKGRIIHDWRVALIDAGAPASEYADEAWASRVGGVSGPHVGRLRRVFQRFGTSYSDYDGLYWSHFQVALDWDDAELWLEGARQSRWSVSQMRRQRWEAMGSLPAEQPRDEEIVAAETDEDCEPAEAREPTAARRGGELGDAATRPIPEGPDFGDEPPVGGHGGADAEAALSTAGVASETVQFVRPFENLAELPGDLAEAFEVFKLAILRHKTDQWNQISCDDVLAALDALKQLAVAPSPD
jgi:hypothetical protein